MRKIISLFQRNYDGDGLVRDEIVPGAEWVVAGEGVATRKWDGTCCMIRGGKLFKRYDAKNGKAPPVGFEPAQDPDPVTGHWPGWLAVGDGPADRWFREAKVQWDWPEGVCSPLGEVEHAPDGTYELIGPKVNGNPEQFGVHVFMPHGNVRFDDAPRTFDALREWFEGATIEGIVWHHPDGRMVKIKKRDFGMNRND